jgi:hypothetical protein
MFPLKTGLQWKVTCVLMFVILLNAKLRIMLKRAEESVESCNDE